MKNDWINQKYNTSWFKYISVNKNSYIFSVDTSCRESSCKLANAIDLNKVIGTGLKEENDKVTDISTSNVW